MIFVYTPTCHLVLCDLRLILPFLFSAPSKIVTISCPNSHIFCFPVHHRGNYCFLVHFLHYYGLAAVTHLNLTFSTYTANPPPVTIAASAVPPLTHIPPLTTPPTQCPQRRRALPSPRRHPPPFDSRNGARRITHDPLEQQMLRHRQRFTRQGIICSGRLLTIHRRRKTLPTSQLALRPRLCRPIRPS